MRDVLLGLGARVEQSELRDRGFCRGRWAAGLLVVWKRRREEGGGGGSSSIENTM